MKQLVWDRQQIKPGLLQSRRQAAFRGNTVDAIS
jgi:hypothetical protein